MPRQITEVFNTHWPGKLYQAQTRSLSGSWVSCNLNFCLVVIFFLLRCSFLFLSLSHCAAVPSCLAAHWRTRTGLAITTAFDNDSGARRHILGFFFIRYHPLNKDPFPVPPFDVTMILRGFRGACGLLLGKLAGLPSITLLQECIDRAGPSS